MRVQIPAYTDRWMKGDRFGEVVKLAKYPGKLGRVAHVKLDVSGKTIRVLIADCTEVEEIA